MVIFSFVNFESCLTALKFYTEDYWLLTFCCLMTSSILTTINLSSALMQLTKAFLDGVSAPSVSVRKIGA